jgi:hypothetical protein
MSLTESMAVWLEELQKILCDLVFKIKMDKSEYTLRFAIVGFKDFNAGLNNIVVKNFTEDLI